MPHRGDYSEDVVLDDQIVPPPELDDGVERDDDVQGLVQRMIEEAVQHYEENLEPDQAEATDYYMGRPFGGEETGRSQVVSTDVRDAVLSVMPSLLRMFFGSETAVEFRPRGPEDIPIARQQTDYVDYIIREDNKGFLLFQGWFKDALVRKIGYVKWWWEDTTKVREASYTGIGQDEMTALALDPNVEVIVDSLVRGEEVMDPASGQSLPTYNVRARHSDRDGRVRVEVVPPEEIVWSPSARSLDTAPLVAHVREVPASDLIEMGIDSDIVENAKGKARKRTAGDDRLESARRHDEGADRTFGREDTQDESTRPVVFAEAYVRVDADEDGVAELRMMQCVGPDYEIVNFDEAGLPGEVVPEVQIAELTPEPEPHAIVGLGFHDLLRDIQRINSQIERGMLDSLALAIEPQAEILNGAVNMQDILNPEVSNVIRVRQMGAYREIKHTFVGPDALPTLAYFRDKAENRVGRHQGAMGLDADALQSSTKSAVAATLSAAQQRVEMIARTFAETGIRKLMMGLLRLVIRHQERSRVVRLRGEWTPIDPRDWDAPMDMSVNVALGAGTPEDKLALLGAIAQKQEQLLQMGSPLTTMVEYRNTLGRFVEMANAGWHSEEFFRPWGPAEEQQAQEQARQQAEQNPPPPDPTQMLVQIEQTKLQMQAMHDQLKLQLEEQKMRLQDDRERDRIARESVLKERELELKHRAEIVDSELRAQVARDRAAMDADVKRQQTSLPAEGT